MALQTRATDGYFIFLPLLNNHIKVVTLSSSFFVMADELYALKKLRSGTCVSDLCGTQTLVLIL